MHWPAWFTMQRVASLGTIFQEAPLVSLVLFSALPELDGFDIHVSRLAQHTRGLLESGRVGLMIAEPDRDTRNPQTIARLSLQGEAEMIPADHTDYQTAREGYLRKFPNAALNFQLGDFWLMRISVQTARW